MTLFLLCILIIVYAYYRFNTEEYKFTKIRKKIRKIISSNFYNICFSYIILVYKGKKYIRTKQNISLCLC